MSCGTYTNNKDLADRFRQINRINQKLIKAIKPLRSKKVNTDKNK